MLKLRCWPVLVVSCNFEKPKNNMLLRIHKSYIFLKIVATLYDLERKAGPLADRAELDEKSIKAVSLGAINALV